MYTHNVEFVFDHMVIITSVLANEPDVSDETIIESAEETLMRHYKLDPVVWFVEDVIVHRGD
jgi:hypothetical protein